MVKVIMFFFLISMLFLFGLLVFFYLFFEKSDLEKDVAVNEKRPELGKTSLISPRKKNILKTHKDTGVKSEK
ncbi:MAG: hypothetical protein K8T10_06520 [Candidatus Eremiobacteraeota bacterium]|nr:hypothetical protein [Candidatus Eremiobacteraeota bacterium]